MKPLFKKNLEHGEKKVVILGIDEGAVLTFAVLLQNEIYVHNFCDPENKETDLRIMNKPIISLDELRGQMEEVILLAGSAHYLKLAESLEGEGFDVYFDFNRASYEGNSILLKEDMEYDQNNM